MLESSVEELERMDRIVSDMLFLAQASHASPALKLEQLSWEVRRIASVNTSKSSPKKPESQRR